MAQEDDLRALGKIMDFMRGISVLFLLINCYWFCYEAFHIWGLTLSVLNKILMNFQRTAGLFSSILWTKLFCVLFLALSCLGTRGVKEEKITWAKIWTVLAIGFVLFFLNWWLLALPIGVVGAASLYIFTVSVGYICLLMAGVWMSRLLKNNLMDDVFNTENESFTRDETDGERVLGQSADTLLLQEEVEQWLDQCGQSVSSFNGLGYAWLGQVFRYRE